MTSSSTAETRTVCATFQFACRNDTCAFTVAPSCASCVADGVIEKLTAVGVVSLSRVIVSVRPTTTTS